VWVSSNLAEGSRIAVDAAWSRSGEKASINIAIAVAVAVAVAGKRVDRRDARGRTASRSRNSGRTRASRSHSGQSLAGINSGDVAIRIPSGRSIVLAFMGVRQGISATTRRGVRISG